MKNIVTACILSAGVAVSVSAQLQTPKASPAAKVEQKVGLTDIKIEYSRPGKNNREIFGKLLPYGEVWRTGANENTKFTTSDLLIMGKDTLKPGTYALYTKPGETSWDLIFYKDATNWGTPENWDESKVALKATTKVIPLPTSKETFSISLENLETGSATIDLSWDKVLVSFPFTVLTDKKVMANIDKVLSGPSSTDYYSAANYYYTEKKDLKKALDWVNKSIELQGNDDAYWVLNTKSLIQAEMGDKKGAVETAKRALASAEKAGNAAYARSINASIKEWGK